MADDPIAQRFAPFGTTIFSEMTALAIKHQAINLAQGFPDFDGPDFVKQAAIKAIDQGINQYSRMQGMPVLNDALAWWWQSSNPARAAIDPDTQITVTSGCTEALAASMLGCINPGDEVILFEPYYDSYRACVAMAGGVPRFVTMRLSHGRFGFDPDELSRAFGDRTRAILVNTPHNPTGTVFTQEELELIASLCMKYDSIALSDEVYEKLVFDDSAEHRSIADVPGMVDRTIVCSSSGKTFSLTGWKIGWAIASPALSKAVRAAHQFITFSAPAPLQIGLAKALAPSIDPATGRQKDYGGVYIDELCLDYASKRRMLCDGLASLGFGVVEPQGTYFIMADHTTLSAPRKIDNDIAFCRYLTQEVGVAAIPPSAFYEHPDEGCRFVRFAFCKQQTTLEQALARLRNAFGSS